MAKRIILCTDGTWDNTAKGTNVFKFYNALQVTSEQIPLYDDGVGADGTPVEQLVGGAFGLGLYQKIKNGYTKIAHLYELGDEVFLFGFSRGAYTARSLAGMIAICGLPAKSFDDSLVDTAFNAYRNKGQRATLLQSLSAFNMDGAKISMVGVWDTVGSLGIPSIIGGVSPILYGFLDTGLHPDVLNAYHALAIDERRAEFPPTLWTSAPAPGQVMEQVWFCGCHSDVGGGTSPGANDAGTTLSDIPLSWMMDKAAALGVQFAPSALTQYKVPVAAKYALDEIHESWNPLWGFPMSRQIAAGVSLSGSVAVRCRQNSSYHPANLVINSGVPDASYPIVATVG
jgi:uncharacterized protein (DUF2235 family)